MFSRRDFLTASVALATIFGPGMQGRWSQVAAQQALSEEDLLAAEAGKYGASRVHVADDVLLAAQPSSLTPPQMERREPGRTP